jgi:antitoxin component YwqK of YwqJK toxin-antitoxin module
MMTPENLFEINLNHMSRFSKKYIEHIKNINCSSYEFCKTVSGELNLKKKTESEDFFFHSQHGAFQEAQQSLQGIEQLKKIEIIYIYGLGLGYFYDAAKKWLQENKNRVLIFLDDDLAAIHRFLELAKATEILTDSQVIVQAFTTLDGPNRLTVPPEFDWICRTFARTRSEIIVQKMYVENRKKASELIQLMLNLRFSEVELYINENTEERLKELYTNFYNNLNALTKAYRGQNVQNLFLNIPSVICGAGSSITKITQKISYLKNKAILFGAGTGMNVLNKMGIIPHFGGGIDPNDESINRIKTNYAYEVPYFYMNRFEHHALQYVHGPLLFLRTASVSLVQDWFEKELGITDSLKVNARVSTTNYLLNVAQIIGCNPLALAGTDLAYTDKSRYPKEIQAHPLDSSMQVKQFKNFSLTSGRLIPMANADGEEIFSRLDWIKEGESYTSFMYEHPGSLLLNLTKGGLPIPQVTNPSIEEFSSTYALKDLDLLNYVHASVQWAGKISVHKDKLDEKFGLWKKSLENCFNICSEIVEFFNSQREEMLESGEVPGTYLTDDVSDALIKLNEEPAYEYCLKTMIVIHKNITFRSMHKFKWYPEVFSAKDSFLKELEFEETKMNFLKGGAKLHLEMVESAIQPIVEEISPEKPPVIKISGDQYKVENGRLIILDPALGLNIDEPFQAVKNPQGPIEGDYYTLNNQLHGPSTFTKHGVLIAEGWFYKGKRIGKNWQYYTNGNIYSIQRFKDGDWHGIQEYYYDNGQKKTILNYTHGLLDGKIQLFHPNGLLAKEVYFDAGKLHGFEKEWNAKGQQLAESQFDHDIPIGRSRKWHSNGELATEKVYYDSVDHYDIHKWDETGLKVKEKLFVKELGMELLEQSKDRRQALEELKKKLEDLKKQQGDS